VMNRPSQRLVDSTTLMTWFASRACMLRRVFAEIRSKINDRVVGRRAVIRQDRGDDVQPYMSYGRTDERQRD